jgi:hypothetical protein
MLGNTVVELTQGFEILSRVFEAVDELEVGFAGLLVQCFALTHDSGPP